MPFSLGFYPKNTLKSAKTASWHVWCSARSMNVSLYQAASALNANARWQEIISENMAAASVPGFKKQELSFSAVEAGVRSAGAGAPAVLLPRASSAINFQQGQVRPTGVPTDVAIDGPGFFEVRLPSGNTAYTRDGEFHLNAQGELVNTQGYPVLGQGGPIRADISKSAPINISSGGDVSQDGEVLGRLKITDFQQPQYLKQIGGGCFLADNFNALPREVEQPSVLQGFLEAANTSTVMEMANLIRVMRGFEANQRIVQIQDERMGKAISELGNPS